jgi:hypothetical protein
MVPPGARGLRVVPGIADAVPAGEYGSRVRPRALPLLLSLTAGDCLLWHRSLAGGHDLLALASGMTLLPLAALSLGLVGLTTLRALARLLRGSSRIAGAMRTARDTQQPLGPQRPAFAAAQPQPRQPTSRPRPDSREPRPNSREPRPDSRQPQPHADEPRPGSRPRRPDRLAA